MNPLEPENRAHRIDTHHHIFPPSYMAKERDRILQPAPGFAKQLTEWTPQKAIDAMDSNGVARKTPSGKKLPLSPVAQPAAAMRLGVATGLPH